MYRGLADFLDEPTWSNGEYGYREEAPSTAHEDPIRLAFQIAGADEGLYERLLQKLAHVMTLYTPLSVTPSELTVTMAEEGEYMVEGRNVAILSNILQMLSIASPKGYLLLRRELHVHVIAEYYEAIRGCGTTPNHEGVNPAFRKMKDAIERLTEAERQGDGVAERENLVREVFLREYQVLLEEFIHPERFVGRLRDTSSFPVSDELQVELDAVKGMSWLLGTYEFPLSHDQVNDTLSRAIHRIISLVEAKDASSLTRSIVTLLTRVLRRCTSDAKLGIYLAWRKVLYELVLQAKEIPIKARIFRELRRLEEELKLPPIPQVQELVERLLVEAVSSKAMEDEERMRCLAALSTLAPTSASEEGWKLYRSSAGNHLLRVAGAWALGTDPSERNFERAERILSPRIPLLGERNIEVLEVALASLFECRELFPDRVRKSLADIKERNGQLASICSAYLTWLEVGIPNLPSAPPYSGVAGEVLERYCSLRAQYVPDYGLLDVQEQRMIDTALHPVRALLPKLVQVGGHLALTTYSVVEANPSLRGTRKRGGGFYDGVAGLASSSGNIMIRRRDLADGSGYETLIHEMGHAAHYHLENDHEELYQEVAEAYQSAIAMGRCIDTYAETDEYEYFAQGTEAYRCVVRDHASLIARYYGGRYGYEDINSTTRSWLMRKDPLLYSLVEQVNKHLEEMGDERIC